MFENSIKIKNCLFLIVFPGIVIIKMKVLKKVEGLTGGYYE